MTLYYMTHVHACIRTYVRTYTTTTRHTTTRRHDDTTIHEGGTTAARRRHDDGTTTHDTRRRHDDTRRSWLITGKATTGAAKHTMFYYIFGLTAREKNGVTLHLLVSPVQKLCK